MAEPALEARELTRRFGALAAVDGVSLAFLPGEVHAVIGPNGAGKSTFLNLLSGELRATSGTVRVRARDVTRSTPDRISRLGVGRSYQTANVFPELTCAQSVLLAALAHQHGSLARAQADAALRSCGLAERSAVRAADLSYGEQRQLELAMIVATRAEVMLLDEPLAGLSAGEAQSVMALLRELRRDRTLVLVEHDMDAVFSAADRITVMVFGRVLETGTPEQIRASAAVRDAYLGDQP